MKNIGQYGINYEMGMTFHEIDLDFLRSFIQSYSGQELDRSLHFEIYV